MLLSLQLSKNENDDALSTGLGKELPPLTHIEIRNVAFKKHLKKWPPAPKGSENPPAKRKEKSKEEIANLIFLWMPKRRLQNKPQRCMANDIQTNWRLSRLSCWSFCQKSFKNKEGKKAKNNNDNLKILKHHFTKNPSTAQVDLSVLEE